MIGRLLDSPPLQHGGESRAAFITEETIYMPDDTRFPAVPEPGPSPECGDPEPPVTTIGANAIPETLQDAGECDEVEPNPETHPSIGDAVSAETGCVPEPATSARRVAANSENAKHSTGPKTEEGKTKSSRNSVKHGIFATKLFIQSKEGADERAEYEELGAQLRDYYEPVGFKQELLVEQIFAGLVRMDRILRYEQAVLTKDASIFQGGLDKAVRYFACHSRELARLIAQLENEQSKCKSQQQVGGDKKSEQTESPSPMAAVLDRAVDKK
jgi:hypothetical protein